MSLTPSFLQRTIEAFRQGPSLLRLFRPLGWHLAECQASCIRADHILAPKGKTEVNVITPWEINMEPKNVFFNYFPFQRDDFQDPC